MQFFCFNFESLSIQLKKIPYWVTDEMKKTKGILYILHEFIE